MRITKTIDVRAPYCIVTLDAGGCQTDIAVESVIGLRREAEALCLTPRLPADCPARRGATARARGTRYVVRFERVGEGDPTSATVDGEAAEIDGATARIPLVSDGAEHAVVVRLGGA